LIEREIKRFTERGRELREEEMREKQCGNRPTKKSLDAIRYSSGEQFFELAAGRKSTY